MQPTDATPEAPRPDWEAFYRDYRKPSYIEGFEITTKLGGGMFGLVFRARRMSIGKDYAIKFLQVDDGEVRRAVLSELEQVKYFAQIDHPNLVSIEDRGEVDGIPYLVMAFAGTETLRDKMPEGRPPTADEKGELVRAFLQAARGLQALHERSLVHFDIKPANVFLKGGVARLGDYGLSKLVTHSRGSLSMGRGTPYYMAPEMLQRRGDQRSDIYSLGVMLYEILCGKVPFTGDSEWEVLRKHETARPELPALLTATERSVLTRSLAKDPEARFQSVDEMIAAFGPVAHLEGAVPRRAAMVPPPARSKSPSQGQRNNQSNNPSNGPRLRHEPPAIPSCLPPPLPHERAAGGPQLRRSPPNPAMPPLPPRRSFSERRQDAQHAAARRRRRGGSSAFGFVALFAAVLIVTLGFFYTMLRAAPHAVSYAEPNSYAVVQQVEEGPRLSRRVRSLVDDKLKSGRRAAQRNRPQTLRPLDLARVSVPEDFEAYREMLQPLAESPRFVPLLAQRLESYGRPACLCAVAMLQELDYQDGLACQQAANLQRFLRQVSGIESLTVEATGHQPSARETCMFLAVADGWREVAERYAFDDDAFERLLAANGKGVSVTVR
ncbi:MAG: serine/threonine-protein kinase [Planctomycetota bacterium]